MPRSLRTPCQPAVKTLLRPVFRLTLCAKSKRTDDVYPCNPERMVQK
jgi:hypothetical protein